MAERYRYWSSEENDRTWHPFKDTPENRAEAIRRGAMFFTWTALSQPINGTGPEPHRWGDLPLDFDNKANPEKALDDLRQLCLVQLPKLYDLDPYAIRYSLTGSKGFHAVIPAHLFGAEAGDPQLPLIYKRIACDWTQRFSLTTLDTSLYCMGRGKMFRLPNVRRANGRYKVPLTLEEIRDLPFNDLWGLGNEPRQIERPEVDLFENADLGEIYRAAHSQVYVRLEETKGSPKLSREEIDKLSSEIPPCIRHILTNHPAKSDRVNFHQLCLTLATYFHMAGADKDAAFSHVERFVEGYQQSETYDSPAKRTREWFTQWAFTDVNPAYQFDCKFVLGLKLPGNAFECKQCPKHVGSEFAEAGPEPGHEPSPSEPIDTDFPLHVMSGAAGRFAEVYSQHLEPPPQFFYFAYLTCLGTVLADRVTIDSAITPQPRLYTLLLGQSADDRKSTAIDKTVQFFRETIQGAFWTCYGTGSAEGLQKKLSKNNRLLLVFDEFKQFVSKCKIDTSVLLPCVNSLYESNRYESNTSKHEINIENGFLAMLAASTVQTYEAIFTPAFIDIGFNNRLFIVTGTGKRRFSVPRSIDPGVMKSMREDLGRVIQMAPVRVGLPFTDDALKLYDAWYMSLEQSIHAKRLDGYALRLMSLLAVNELQANIGVEIVKKVLALVNWQLQVRKVYDPIDADGVVATLEERIRRGLSKAGTLTERDLKRQVNAHRTGLFFYESAKKNLLAAGEIAFNPKQKAYSRVA